MRYIIDDRDSRERPALAATRWLVCAHHHGPASRLRHGLAGGMLASLQYPLDGEARLGSRGRNRLNK